MRKIFLPLLTTLTIASPLLSLTACNKTPTHEDPFSKDDWSVILDLANTGGLEALKEHYNVDSFIGKTKTVTVEGFKYDVQVIGENEDVLSDNSGNAALTFMFKTVIQDYDENAGFSPHWTYFNTGEDLYEENMWMHSEPRKFLNGPDGFSTKLEAAITKNYEGEGKGLKQVLKNTIAIHGNGTVESQEETLFLPSLADVFSCQEETFQLPDPDEGVNPEAYIQEANTNPTDPSLRGNNYNYFKNIVDKPCKDEEGGRIAHNELAVSDGHDKTTSYWLRTQIPTTDGRQWSEWVWYHIDGKLYEVKCGPNPELNEDTQCAIVPCFCI